MNKIIIAIILLTFSQINAQDSIDLKRLINRTLQANYQIKIIKNQQQISENMNTAGNAGMLPKIDLSSSASADISSSESKFFNGSSRVGNNALSSKMNAMAELNYTVFDGFRMFAEKDKLNLLASRSAIETKFFIDQTVSDLAKAYYSLIKEIEILQLYQESLKISKYRLNVESKKKKIGSGNSLLYNQAVVDFNSDSSIIINKKMIIENLKVQINRLSNKSPDNNLSPTEKVIELQGIENIQTVMDKAIENNKEVEMAKIEEMISEANLRIAKSASYPQIDLFGNYSLSQQKSQVGFIESANNRGLNFGVRVRFNLYDGGKQKTQIKNANLEFENSGLNLEDSRLYMKSEITQLINTYNSYLEQFKLLEKSYNATKNSLKIASQQLKFGDINGFEFRQTQVAIIQLQNQIIKLKYNMRLIEIDIYRISGELMLKLI